MAFEIDLPPLTWHPNNSVNAPALNMLAQTILKRPYWAFDSVGNENITSQQLVIPSNYDSSAALKLKVLCGHNVQKTGSDRTVQWEAFCETISVLGSSGEDVTTGNGVAASANIGQVTFGTGATFPMYEVDITLTQTDTAAAGKPFRVSIQRNNTVSGGLTNYSDDAFLYGVMLFQE